MSAQWTSRLLASLRQRSASLPARITAIAMLPALVLAMLLGGLAISLRQDDLESSLAQRGLLLARQLASAADYGVFSGNRVALQALADSVAREQSVVGVRILDREGQVLAQTATPSSIDTTPQAPLRFREPIRSPRIAIDDLDQASPAVPGQTGAGAPREADRNNAPRPSTPTLETAGPPLITEVIAGSAEVHLSRAQIEAEKRRFALAVVGILISVLIVTGFVARRMSRRVSRPVVDAALAVERIGRGESGVRVQPSTIGVLDLLGRGVNEMAGQLEASIQTLESRVHEATAQLIEKKEEAERANRAKSRFLAAASHDLRQPMHALGMFVEALSQQPANPMQRELLGQIDRAAAAMGDLLDSLLDISRLDAGVIEKRVAPLSLAGVFERVRNEFTGPAQAKGLTLVVRRSGRWVLSDRILLERILINLVSNAIRYTDHGTVLVAARVCGADREHLRIDVRDSGSGIDPAAQEAIFQEFVQLANPERDRSKGLGLGLSIVRRLVVLLDHRLILRSAPGRGSTFSVILPLAMLASTPTSVPAPPRAQAPSSLPAATPPSMPTTPVSGPNAAAPPASEGVDATPAVPTPLRTARFLVIDDDAMVRAGLVQLLASWGAQVSEEPGDAQLPQRLVGRPLPDVILCDMRLADGLDGVALLAAIRQAVGKPVLAVVITGDTDPERVSMAGAGGDPVLHKPVRPAQLRALLRHLMQQRREALKRPPAG